MMPSLKESGGNAQIVAWRPQPIRRRAPRHGTIERGGGMATGASVRQILLHGGMDETFDRSVVMARQLAESFHARLHVVYTVEDPLSAGWTAEKGAERMPELHQAMVDEARERLSRLIPIEDQDRLGVEIVLRTGPADDEL